MGKARIGFVGTGFMGQCAHLQNYAQLPDECEVTAIAEVRPELGRKVAARYGIANVYANHSQMLEREELDGIVASQPFWRHGVLLPDLFRAGVPVFTEKPLSCSVEAGEAIVKALQSSGSRYYVGYHKRSDPASLYARREIERIVESGELGALRYVLESIERGSCTAFNLANINCGPTYIRRIYALAESAGIKCLIGTDQESTLGIAGHLHVGASVPNLDLPCDPMGTMLYTESPAKETDPRRRHLLDGTRWSWPGYRA